MVCQETIKLSTRGFADVIDITREVSRIVRTSKVREGLVLVFLVGSTGAVTTIEAEPNLVQDFQEMIERLVPQNKKYHHDATWGDGNGFAHLRASLLGPSLALAVGGGELELGAWQQIVVCDFDNRARQREVRLLVMGES